MGRSKDVRLIAHAAELLRRGVSSRDARAELQRDHGLTYKTALRYVRDVEKRSADVELEDGREELTRTSVAQLKLPDVGSFPDVDKMPAQLRVEVAAYLKGWLDRVDAELDSPEGIVVGYKEIRVTKDEPGELLAIKLNRPAAYGRMVKVVDLISKLLGLHAPQQVQVTGAVAHAHATVGQDPLEMSPAERRRELARLDAQLAELRGAGAIDVG